MRPWIAALVIIVLCPLHGEAAGPNNYARAAEILAKYAAELVPTKRGMVEVGIAAVAYDWLSQTVWAKPDPKPMPSPAPIPPPDMPDFNVARANACADSVLGASDKILLGCFGRAPPPPTTDNPWAQWNGRPACEDPLRSGWVCAAKKCSIFETLQDEDGSCFPHRVVMRRMPEPQRP
jgi:hypothetical protein